MRIIHILTRLLRAGSEENTIASALYQARAGHEVIILHGPDPDPHWRNTYGAELTFTPIDCLVHPIRPASDIKAIKACRAVFLNTNPDVIHTHQSKAGIIGRLASSVVPSALVVHGIHIIPFAGVSLFKKWVYIAAEKLAARYTDYFVAVSKSVGQSYVDAGITDQFKTIYSGMDLEPFRSATPPADASDLIGTRFDHPDRPKIILMVAAFEPRKRHIPFLEAVAHNRDALSGCKILLAGRGPYEERVRAAVSDLGLSEQVIFTGYRSDPEALMAMCDVCVLTSEREGLPRVVVQSMAAGKPVIVSQLPGIEEIVQHEINGLVTNEHNLDDAVQNLIKLIHDDVWLESLSTGARQTDVSNWELDTLGRQTLKLYLDGLKELPPTRRSQSTPPDKVLS